MYMKIIQMSWSDTDCLLPILMLLQVAMDVLLVLFLVASTWVS